MGQGLLPPYPYDPEKAQQLLAEAGYGDGLEMTLYTLTSETRSKLNRAVSRARCELNGLRRRIGIAKNA